MRIKWGRMLLGLLVVAVGCAALFLLSVGPVTEWVGDIRSEVDSSISGATRVGGRPSSEQTARPPESDVGDGESEEQPGAADAPSDASAEDAIDESELPPFRVMTLQYTPYMATLAHMDAGGYMERLGWDLQLVDVYGDADLDEDGQCQALKDGTYDGLATTLDATRKCGPGVVTAIPIGQSAGNDGIVVRGDVDTWSEIFEFAIAYTAGSVSEYMACFASHTAATRIEFAVEVDDASEAVDAWIEPGVEQPVLSVVAWEPELSRALEAVPDARVILSSRDVRILWDVINFPAEAAAADRDGAYTAFTTAYYQALRDLTENPGAAARAIAAWAEGDPAREGLVTTVDPQEFEAELDLEAFATLRDAAILMEEERTLLNRLEEADFYWTYCDVEVPEVADVSSLVQPSFVTAAREIDSLLTAPGRRPSAEVFQVSDFTNRDAITDDQIARARQIFQTGVDIEFRPNTTDFRNPANAQQVLEDAVRFLRTCSDCYLEIQGSSAFPAGADRLGFTLQDADELAVNRGNRVYLELRDRFEVPDAQLRFIEEPAPRRFPGSPNEEELRLDRRTYLTGYQLAGGL